MKRVIYATNTFDSLYRFHVGEVYRTSTPYGGQLRFKVVSRTPSTVTLEERHVSEDDNSIVDDDIQEYPIVIQKVYGDSLDTYNDVIGEQESVKIWEYNGYEGYLYAENR